MGEIQIVPHGVLGIHKPASRAPGWVWSVQKGNDTTTTLPPLLSFQPEQSQFYARDVCVC